VIRLDCSPRRWARRQWIALLTLTALSLFGQVLHFFFPHPSFIPFIRQVDLDGEANLPSWFQGMTLMVAAGLFALIAHVERRQGKRGVGCWCALALGFAYMSADEITIIHEHALVPIQMLRNIPAFHSFSWIYPAFALIVALFLFFRRWLIDLSPASRTRFIVAGAVYVGGAVGFEGIGGIEAITVGLHNWVYVFTYTIEEFLEMVGMLLLIQAQLEHLHAFAPRLELSFEAADGREAKVPA
jgi:hypothetical protein